MKEFSYMSYKSMVALTKEEVYDRILSILEYYYEHSEEWFSNMGDEKGEITLDSSDFSGGYIYSIQKDKVQLDMTGDLEDRPIEWLKSITHDEIFNVLSNLEGTMYNNR